jgi:ABC-type phosphate transport system substrate-binding protein
MEGSSTEAFGSDSDPRYTAVTLSRRAEQRGRIRPRLGRLDEGGGERRGGQDAARPARVDYERPGQARLPATSFTWMLLYENAERRRSRLMVDFLRWALSDGQTMAPDLGYAPLPPEVVSLAREALRKIKT